MRSDGVVIVAPERQLAPGVVQGVEDLLVQELGTQAAVKALDEGMSLGFAWVDVMLAHPVLVGPRPDCAAGELGAVIADEASRLAVYPHQCIQLACYTGARDAVVGSQAQALAAAI